MCDLAIVSFPVVTVRDAVSGQHLCDATVIVTAMASTVGIPTGPATQSPSMSPVDAGLDGTAFLISMTEDGGVCEYMITLQGGLEVVDTLQVSRPGYRPEIVSNLHANAEACGGQPAPETVIVSLQPVRS
jgi:hypothetical protein